MNIETNSTIMVIWRNSFHQELVIEWNKWKVLLDKKGKSG